MVSNVGDDDDHDGRLGFDEIFDSSETCEDEDDDNDNDADDPSSSKSCEDEDEEEDEDENDNDSDEDDEEDDDDNYYSSEACDDEDDYSSESTTGGPDNRLLDFFRNANHVAEEEAQSEVVQLEDGLWDCLPLELVDKILAWLPPAGHFRFRCVCKRWRSLLSSSEWLSRNAAEAQPRASCIVMCAVGSSSARFFCSSEQKWFKLPLYSINTMHMQLEWELVATDGGLVCYRCKWRGESWFSVCNPLTKSFKVILLKYPPNLYVLTRKYEVLKLHVDRETKSFKVIVFLRYNYPQTTLMYDSLTSLWSECGNYPNCFVDAYNLFVRKNVMYSKCFERKNILLTFDLELGLWSNIETDYPGNPMTKYFIVNNNGRGVLLIQIRTSAEECTSSREECMSSEEECLSVWKLRDEASDFSRSSWIKVPLHVPSTFKPLLEDFETCVSQGDWIFFTTRSTNLYVRYSFATKSWQERPLQYREHCRYYWFSWEPRLDMNVETQPVQSSDQSIFESYLREGV